MAPTFIFGDSALATDGQELFFFGPAPDDGPFTILKQPITGGPSETVTKCDPSGDRKAFAVDAISIYWLESMKIVKAPRSGNGAHVDLVPDVGNVMSMAADRTHLYWSERDSSGTGSVRRVPVDGGPAEVLERDYPLLWGIAIDDTNVYWATNVDKYGRIFKRSKSGGPPIVLASGQDDPVHVVVDAVNVYWGNAGDGMVRAVNK